MTELHRLRAKLCRELAQSEQDTKIDPQREARRLGAVPPAEALAAIAHHAEAVWPRFRALVARDRTLGLGLGRALGAMLSAIRHALIDRLIDAERSYRGTLLSVHRGVDTARLLLEVAVRAGDAPLARFCEDLLAERLALIESAEQELSWFASEPAFAIASGLRLAIAPPRTR